MQKSSECRAFAAGLVETAPLAAYFFNSLAREIDDGGELGNLVVDHPSSAIPLAGVRMLSAAYQLTLRGKTPELAAVLDEVIHSQVPVDSAYAKAWDLTRQAVLAYPDEVYAAMSTPVQQQHPGRASALLQGLAMLAFRRVRLLEIGACAGLSLALDRYHWIGSGWEWGDPSSPVKLPADGYWRPRAEIVQRAGCDLLPRNAGSPEDRLISQSFVPLEQPAYQQLLEQAMVLTEQAGIKVEASAAAPWLRRALSERADPGVATVVWHSMMWGYVEPNEQREIESILADASSRMPLARVSFEPAAWGDLPLLRVSVYPSMS
ncbi:MAG: hypothetical protein JWN95_1467 [Frankiales bacterium]|nr:hypothetical protein [Frankiales bacterium]